MEEYKLYEILKSHIIIQCITKLLELSSGKSSITCTLLQICRIEYLYRVVLALSLLYNYNFCYWTCIYDRRKKNI